MLYSSLPYCTILSSNIKDEEDEMPATYNGPTSDALADRLQAVGVGLEIFRVLEWGLEVQCRLV